MSAERSVEKSTAKDGGHQLKALLVEEAQRLGIAVVGIAPVERWGEYGEIPENLRPRALWPSAKTVVVLGVPIQLPVIETAPSRLYLEMYDIANRVLDEASYRLGNWLNARGHASMSLQRNGIVPNQGALDGSGGRFSHVFAGKYAGLGTRGLIGVLLSPEFGPRVRLNSLLTAVDLPADSVIEDDLCDGCGICAFSCPVSAIDPIDNAVVGKFNKKTCGKRDRELEESGNSPCGICVKVCPKGEDFALYGQ